MIQPGSTKGNAQFLVIDGNKLYQRCPAPFPYSVTAID
jgi:hypothetical protein